MSLTLAQALESNNIEFEWMQDIWKGQSSIAIFNKDRRFSIHCHAVENKIYYCFYDDRVFITTQEWPLVAIANMMAEFDRFILLNSANLLVDPPK